MAYIPKDTEWFLAQFVEEFRVQGRKRNVVHINYILIQAKTPEQAYRKALQLGKVRNNSWKNPAGQTVTHRFLGLRMLDVIHDSLEHGCEIMYLEQLGVSRAGLRKLVCKKEQLEAFLPVPETIPRGRPDFSSKEIMDMLMEQLKSGRTASPSRRRSRPKAVRKSRNR